MKRALMTGALLLFLMSLSGCLLLLGWNHDITYRIDANGSDAVLTVTWTDQNGDLQTETGVIGSWGRTFSVSGGRGSGFLAFVQADTTASLSPFLLEASIRVDGSQKAYDSEIGGYPLAKASFLAD
jgi:hypothetical protein